MATFSDAFKFQQSLEVDLDQVDNAMSWTSTVAADDADAFHRPSEAAQTAIPPEHDHLLGLDRQLPPEEETAIQLLPVHSQVGFIGESPAGIGRHVGADGSAERSLP